MMKCPFPGFDPYLEPFWSGFHTRMMVQLCDQLTGQLPKGLWADVEETVVVEGHFDEKSYYRPDAAVFDSEPWDANTGDDEAEIAVAEPLIVAAGTLEQTERTLIITDTTTGDHVVTAIELLSPANKLGTENRARYLSKRNAYRAAGANVVEIDLIRSGNYLVGAPEHVVPSSQRNERIISVYRSYTMKWEIYTVPLRAKLPAFRTPLRAGDRDVVLQLQPAFEEVFEKGGYGTRINYSGPPEPRLNEEDSAWSDALLRESKLRI